MKKLPIEIELEFLKLIEALKSQVDNVFIYDHAKPEIVWHQSDPTTLYSREKINELADLLNWSSVFFLPHNDR